MNSVIIYDGDCGFCSRTVMFLAKNDTNNCFKFVSNHSNFGVELLEKHKIKGIEQSTIILIENDNIYTRSSALRKILLRIPYFRILGYGMFLVPKKASDCFYDFISNRRKRIVKNSDCKIPTLEIRNKFII